MRLRPLLVAAAPALLVTGALLVAVGVGEQQPAPPVLTAPSSGTPSDPVPSSADSGTDVLPASEPVRLTIPGIAVSTSLERLGLNRDRVMQTPRDPDKAGWYRLGPAPGSRGPAVIAGHVTWNGARSVFFRLAELQPGARVEVLRADGTTAVFTVTRTAQYPKDRFPSIDVYRNLDHAGLRLITCAGDYSPEDRRYADNIVVYARLSTPGS
ncbi:class F sortase [Streptomyces sp. NPDC057798]|uniref:class F sortase n=1 Tax=Streptomyces sp. NPDC057798 TaxID=3346252 RepID=UPI00369DF8EE